VSPESIKAEAGKPHAADAERGVRGFTLKANGTIRIKLQSAIGEKHGRKN
jgi:hypothetical protein